MTVNLIWDLDGTLIDSYPITLEALAVTYRHFGLVFDRAYVKRYIIDYSIRQLVDQLEAAGQVARQPFVHYLKQETMQRDAEIPLMRGAGEVLAQTYAKGVRHFVYTHKDNSAFEVLERLGIAQYMTEVVTIEHGFKRKPDGEGILYLLDRHQLDPKDTYYVGDRLLDIAAAHHAGVGSINFMTTADDEIQDNQIHQLTDILTLPFIP